MRFSFGGSLAPRSRACRFRGGPFVMLSTNLGGGRDAVHAPDLRRREALGRPERGRARLGHAGVLHVHAGPARQRRVRRRRPAAADVDRDDRTAARGRPARHRRSVRGDEGAARRLLPDRGRVDRRGDRPRGEDPVGAARLDRGPPGAGAAGRGARIEELARLFREEHGRVLATLIRVLGDFDLAEDALGDAVATALERWPRDGVPDNPAAWLVTTARNRAIDRIRRERTLRRKAELLDPEAPPVTDDFPDERLSLIFTCCHPALAVETQVALTLRTLGGLTTEEIARAFLVPEPTMAQRLVRAKAKIRG